MTYDTTKWGDLFPTTIGNESRPTDAIDNTLDFATDKFPQFIANDPVNYTLQNAFLRQLFSNDRYLYVLVENALGNTMTGATDAVDGKLGQCTAPKKGQQNSLWGGDATWKSKSDVLGPVGKTQPTLTALVDWDTMKTLNNGVDVRTAYNKNQNTGIVGYGGDVTALNNGDIILKQDFSTFDAMCINYADDLCLQENWKLIPMWLFIRQFNTKGIGYLFNEINAIGDAYAIPKLPQGWDSSVDSTAVSKIATNIRSYLINGSSVSGISTPTIHNVTGSFWGFFGANSTYRPSTKKRFNMPSIKDGVIISSYDTSSNSFQNSSIIEIYGVTY
jgi:hypothetical protein